MLFLMSEKSILFNCYTLKVKGKPLLRMSTFMISLHTHTHTQMDVYKSILKYCRSQDDDLDSELSQWEGKLAHLLEAHPELANRGRGGGEDSGESDEEDSQGLENYQDLSDVPSSLPSEGLCKCALPPVPHPISLSIHVHVFSCQYHRVDRLYN